MFQALKRVRIGWRANIGVLLLVASGSASAQGGHARPDRVTEIHFARSGGLVGSQGSVEGTVIIPTGGAARLKAKNPEYSRNLSPREVTQLKSVDIGKLCQAKPRAAAAADQYTYEITLKAADGKNCDLTI